MTAEPKWATAWTSMSHLATSTGVGDQAMESVRRAAASTAGAAMATAEHHIPPIDQQRRRVPCRRFRRIRAADSTEQVPRAIIGGYG